MSISLFCYEIATKLLRFLPLEQTATTSFQQLNCKAINKVSLVFQLKNLIAITLNVSETLHYPWIPSLQ